MTLDNMTGITEGSYTGFCKSQLITCNFVKACNGVCPFEDALKHADKMQTMNDQHTVDHDRDWIIGCIEHDGFIHTHRFDKANQIIHDALSAENSNAKTQNSNQETQKSNGNLIYRADAIEAVEGLTKYMEKLVEGAEKFPEAHTKNYKHDMEQQIVGVAHASQVILELPSAEAVQGEGVRCGECKHRYMDGEVTHYYWCRLHDRPVDDADYCAWGEESEVEE